MKAFLSLLLLTVGVSASAEQQLLNVCEQVFYKRALDAALNSIHRLEHARAREWDNMLQPEMSHEYLPESVALKNFEDDYQELLTDLHICEGH